MKAACTNREATSRVVDEIVAICMRGAKRQTIPVLDLRIPEPAPEGAEWIAAYRHWKKGFR